MPLLEKCRWYLVLVPGVLLHDSRSWSEGDFNRKGSSAFSGKVGQQVASSLVTVVDNGNLSIVVAL